MVFSPAISSNQQKKVTVNFSRSLFKLVWALPRMNQGTDKDSWAHDENTGTRIPKSQVPDAWDDDNEDESHARTAPMNRQLWEEANSQAPMPQVIMNSSASSIKTPVPQAAFNAPKMILKRAPKPAPATSSSPGASNPKRFEDREAAYQAARERIFGTPSPSPPVGAAQNASDVGAAGTSSADLPATQNSESQITGQPKPPVPLRHPRGPPPAAPGQAQPGFAGRKSQAPRGHRRVDSDLDIATFIATTTSSS